WTWGIANQARKGERWGTLVGGGYDRVEEGPMAGAIKVNNRGLVVNKAAQNIGNVTPDFLASWRNDFRYNDFSFGFLLDLRVGGRSEEHTSELQSRENIVCRLLLEKTK